MQPSREPLDETLAREQLTIVNGELRKWERAENGVWIGWRGNPQTADAIIGDYMFRWFGADGFRAQQSLSHEFVTGFPKYVPNYDPDHGLSVAEWWLDRVFSAYAEELAPSEVDGVPDYDAYADDYGVYGSAG